MKITLLLLSFLYLAACTTNPIESNAHQEFVDQQLNYEGLIEANVLEDAVYDGFYNKFQYKLIMLTTKIVDTQLERQGELFQWDAAKLGSEKDKAHQTMNNKSEVFVSFFAPEKASSKLDDKRTVWRILLDVGGKRYVGEAKKLSKPVAELAVLYPFHDRWSQPYIVSFNVPMALVESNPVKFTITGPVGNSTIAVPPTTTSRP